jgi:post-segregation antitoxin (ccd killing protein)
MAEITIKIPDELKKRAEEADVDMSLVVQRLIKHLEEEKEMIDWSVKLQRASRRGRYEELKRRG